MTDIPLIKQSATFSEAKNMLIKLCNKCMLQQHGCCTTKELKIVCNICEAKEVIEEIK